VINFSTLKIGDKLLKITNHHHFTYVVSAIFDNGDKIHLDDELGNKTIPYRKEWNDETILERYP
jgi:hypothetical protein